MADLRVLMDRAELLDNGQGDNIAAEVPIDVWREMAVLAMEHLDLQAKVMEYEHVLGHVCDEHPVPGAPPQSTCSECQRMAQAALDGTYRGQYLADVIDLLRDGYEV